MNQSPLLPLLELVPLVCVSLLARGCQESTTPAHQPNALFACACALLAACVRCSHAPTSCQPSKFLAHWLCAASGHEHWPRTGRNRLSGMKLFVRQRLPESGRERKDNAKLWRDSSPCSHWRGGEQLAAAAVNRLALCCVGMCCWGLDKWSGCLAKVWTGGRTRLAAALLPLFVSKLTNQPASRWWRAFPTPTTNRRWAKPFLHPFLPFHTANQPVQSIPIPMAVGLGLNFCLFPSRVLPTASFAWNILVGAKRESKNVKLLKCHPNFVRLLGKKCTLAKVQLLGSRAHFSFHPQKLGHSTDCCTRKNAGTNIGARFGSLFAAEHRFPTIPSGKWHRRAV